MKLIIDFYKGLDTLNLIIFWGIIIVIILLLIFSFILMNKNKKLKSIVEQKNKSEEELPIKKEEIIISPIVKEDEMLQEQLKEENISKPIETENKFVAEEHVIDYSKSSVDLSVNENNIKEEKNAPQTNTKKSIELPTGPYQRNVLREMSLSQTSPIGINRQESKFDKKIEIAQDLEESLNGKELDGIEQKTKTNCNIKEVNNEIKKELKSIEETSSRKTEIKIESPTKTQISIESKVTREQPKSNFKYYESPVKEILDEQSPTSVEPQRKSSSEKYLEEVSRKLAEAEIPDEIERTNYELKQEEDAIISYKELMEKKDTIQTIDEEEAVISIEELMNRTNQKKELPKEEAKLYNLSEEEENDNFIKELKQFRNDL